MKTCLLHILTLIAFESYYQDFKTPDLEFQNQYSSINPYLKTLNLENENSLIIRLSYSSYWYKKGKVNRYIVYQGNEDIIVYKEFIPTEKSKSRIKKRKIKGLDKIQFQNCLKKVVSDRMLEIDQSKLNIKSKRTSDDQYTHISVSDGITYRFEIAKNNRFTEFYSYAPQTYIEEEFPGFEDRQKLLNLMDIFENLFKRVNL